jgi:hypothetical protein
MSGYVIRFLDRIREPEHTGDDRCVPCTVVNVAIALVVTALASVIAMQLAAVVFGLSVLAIYFRGYLLPGTPALTKRYLPESVLAAFDKHPTEERRDGGQTFETVEKLERQRRNSVDPEQFLADAGAVEPCDSDDEEFRLTDDFADIVEQRLKPYRDASPDRAALAAVFNTSPGGVTFKDREYPAITIDRRVRKWPSEGALVADVATHEALSERADGWADVPLEQRLDILESLRSLHEQCPLCSGSVQLSTDTVESCCRAYEVVALRCLDCEKPLLEFDPSEITDGTHAKGIQP